MQGFLKDFFKMLPYHCAGRSLSSQLVSYNTICERQQLIAHFLTEVNLLEFSASFPNLTFNASYNDPNSAERANAQSLVDEWVNASFPQEFLGENGTVEATVTKAESGSVILTIMYVSKEWTIGAPLVKKFLAETTKNVALLFRWRLSSILSLLYTQ